MRDLKLKVFFYDGEDYSTGEMISLGEAYAEGCIEIENDEIKASDKCSIILQYTGIKDKNGKDVYEKDILLCRSNDYDPKYKEMIFLVKHDDDRTGFYPFNIDWDYGGVDFWDFFFKFEVIGNLFETPEQLEIK